METAKNLTAAEIFWNRAFLKPQSQVIDYRWWLCFISTRLRGRNLSCCCFHFRYTWVWEIKWQWQRGIPESRSTETSAINLQQYNLRAPRVPVPGCWLITFKLNLGAPALFSFLQKGTPKVIDTNKGSGPKPIPGLWHESILILPENDVRATHFIM